MAKTCYIHKAEAKKIDKCSKAESFCKKIKIFLISLRKCIVLLSIKIK